MAWESYCPRLFVDETKDMNRETSMHRLSFQFPKKPWNKQDVTGNKLKGSLSQIDGGCKFSGHTQDWPDYTCNKTWLTAFNWAEIKDFKSLSEASLKSTSIRMSCYLTWEKLSVCLSVTIPHMKCPSSFRFSKKTEAYPISFQRWNTFQTCNPPDFKVSELMKNIPPYDVMLILSLFYVPFYIVYFNKNILKNSITPYGEIS